MRFSGFTDEWSEHKFENIFDIKNGLNKGKDYFGEGIQILNYMDVNKYELNTENTIKDLVELGDDEIERYSVKPNDLFFTRTSETSEEIGLTSAYMGNTIKCVFSGFLLRARPKIDLNSLFFAYYLRSPRQRNNIIKFSSITTRALISGGNLSKMKIKYPDIEEQNKIANLFLILDKKVELLESKYQQYQEFKKYLMQQIFTQKLRFNFTDGWKIVKLETLIKKGKAGGTPSSTNLDYYNGDIPFLSIKDMSEQGKYIVKTEKSITNEGLNNSSAWIIPKYSLLYSIYASIGLVAINRTEISTSQAIYGIILKEGVSLEYMYYYLTYFKKNVHRYIETGTQGNLNAKLLKSFEVLLPSLKEQEMIVNILSFADEKIENTEKEIIKMNEFKKGLLQQMFV